MDLEKIKPESQSFDKELVSKCHELNCLPLRVAGDTLFIASDNPEVLDNPKEALASLGFANYKIGYSLTPVLEELIFDQHAVYGLNKPKEQIEMKAEELEAKDLGHTEDSPKDSEKPQDESQDDLDQEEAPEEEPFKPVVKKFSTDDERQAPDVLNDVIATALNAQASDIHLEPYPQGVAVRYRIDGVVQSYGELPMGTYGNLVNRIKVLGHLRIDEHSTVQDGSLLFETNKQTIDARISIVPSIHGERIALRILNAYVEAAKIEDLGFDEVQIMRVEERTRKPHGLILVTGPTGAGKTTTLYSILQSITTPEVNVVTIEDPVEYRIRGVTQIQVNEEQEVTFARGLRAIVRQDPDIILVGEIRDEETAEIAVNAALTGHLVLSTLHANDSATAVPRMLEMGVEPFLLSSTLELVIAQRLVRKLCPECKKPLSKPSKKLADMLSFLPNVDFKKLYEAHGCDKCTFTGYKGRLAIFEILTISPNIREAMLSKPSAADIWKIALDEGGASLFDDGLRKANMGLTTIEEVLRVAPPN